MKVKPGYTRHSETWGSLADFRGGHQGCSRAALRTGAGVAGGSEEMANSTAW